MTDESDKIKRLVFTTFFLALGVVIPKIFHLIGLGAAFLPMHIPVLLGGLFLGPAAGFILGFSTPMISSITTGMPPLMPPIAFMMTFELAVMGAAAGFLHRKLCFKIYPSLIITILLGRLVFAILVQLLSTYLINTETTVWTYIAGAIIFAAPGFILQLTVIPAILLVLNKLTDNLGCCPCMEAEVKK